MIAPIAALHNPLASHLTSSKVSILASSALYINPPTNALDELLPKSQAHAAAERNTFTYIHDSQLHIVVEGVTAVCPTRLHFEPQALAVRELSERVLVAVAGYDGIYIARWKNGNISALKTLPGTEGYPVVAVAISDDGGVVAGSMDGQVAQWKGMEAVASVSLEVPEDAAAGDRITQVAVVKGDIVVAWWSGRVSVGERVIKTAKRAVSEFSRKGGVYFVEVEEGIIVVRGDVWMYYIGKELKRRRMHGDVVGICRCGRDVLVWIRDEGLSKVDGWATSDEWEVLKEPKQRVTKGDGEGSSEDKPVMGEE